MNVKYCKSENELHNSSLWRACPDFPIAIGTGGVGGAMKKDIHFSGLQYFTDSSNK